MTVSFSHCVLWPCNFVWVITSSCGLKWYIMSPGKCFLWNFQTSFFCKEIIKTQFFLKILWKNSNFFLIFWILINIYWQINLKFELQTTEENFLRLVSQWYFLKRILHCLKNISNTHIIVVRHEKMFLWSFEAVTSKWFANQNSKIKKKLEFSRKIFKKNQF